MFHPARTPIDQYRQVDTQTAVSQADPHGLIMLLYDGAIAAIQQARHAMATSDTPTKVARIGKAMRIVDEGLRASVQSRGDTSLAANLCDLYDHVGTRLLEANARNLDEPLAEAVRLLSDLREAWNSIAPPKTVVEPHTHA